MRSEVQFNNTAKAFSARTNSQLDHSFWLFRLMQQPFLVKILSALTIFSIRIHLPIRTLIKRTIFKQFCGGETLKEATKEVANLQRSKIGSILDYSVEGGNNEKDFERTKKEILKIISLAENNPAIPYTSLKVTGIIDPLILELKSAGKILTTDEKDRYAKGKNRIEEICQQAYSAKVPVYFDAEESWIQKEIDVLAESMMKEFNSGSAIVLTTLQMYRTDRLTYLSELINKGRKEKFFLGIKLVRGAYLEKENARAGQFGYPSPIHASKSDTDYDFDKAVTMCLNNIDLITLCAGTHNEKSTMHLLNEMKEKGIENDHPNVYFSQLFGMSDNITYNLADANYNVTKYLPYGPVRSVIPYLIRRANENTAIAGQMSRELHLINEERQRRSQNKLLTS